MKHITIKTISIRNFKGIADLTLNFSDGENTLAGANGIGKSSVFDAFCWCLFGKDSDDRAAFEVKPLGPDGKPIPRLETSVAVTLSENGMHVVLHRKLVENWTKKRGSEVAEFTGNITEYFIHGVPLKAKEYAERVSSILDESLFKILSSPTYFNQMKWQDRRKILLDVVGEIKHEEILATMKTDEADPYALFDQLFPEPISIEDQRKKLAAEQSRLAKELRDIPARISEVGEQIKVIPPSREHVLGQIDELERELTQNESERDESLRALLIEEEETFNKLSQEYVHHKDKLMAQANQAYWKMQNDIAELELAESREKTLVKTYFLDLDTHQKRKSSFNATLSGLRQDWQEIDQKLPDLKNEVCPECQRPFTATERQELNDRIVESFNLWKQKALSSIEKRATSIKDQIKSEEESEKETKAAIDTHEEKLEKIKGVLELKREQHLSQAERLSKLVAGSGELSAINEQSKQVAARINSLRDQIKTKEVDTTSERKEALRKEISALHEQLAEIRQYKQASNRLVELNEQERTTAQALADVERKLYFLFNYQTTQMRRLELAVNDLFKVTKFRLFEDRIGGGQTETCDALVAGVPWSDANTAGKIQSGLDIIRVLNDHYQMTVPVFIDNRESVTEIPEVPGQIINLIVRSEVKSLTLSQTNQLTNA